MNNSKELRVGAALSYIQMAANVIINLLYTPIMISLLGKSEYGLYNTVASTISMLSILSLGFNSGYVKYYTKYKKEGSNEGVCSLNGLYLTVFILIGIVALLCGIVLTNNMDIVFDKGLTQAEYSTARILMALLTVNLAISFPMSVFANIISAHEKFILLKTIGLLKTVFSPLLSLPLLLMGYKSIAIVMATLCVSAVTDTIYMYYVIFKMKEKFVFRKYEDGIFYSIFSYTIFIALNIFIDQINWNIDKLLLGRFKGTESVAIYSVGFVLYQSYQLCSTSISGVFTPRIHKLVSQDYTSEIEKTHSITSLFIKVGRVQFLILGLVCSGIIFYGKYFITNVWAGREYNESYYVALLLIIPASIALIQNLGIEIQRAENKHRFRSVIYSIMAVINLIISIILCQVYGAVGSAIGTAISLIVANGIIMNIYYYRQCNINVIEFWKNILRMSYGFLPPILFAIIVNYIFPVSSFYSFFIDVFLYICVYLISVWVFSMNSEEKNLILHPMMRFVRRVRRIK